MATIKLNPLEQAQKIESYFDRAPAFAQPICAILREAIATADPDLTPTWKWNSPVYEKNETGMILGIGIFKEHVRMSFFEGALIPLPAGFSVASEESKSMRGLKFTDANQIPVPELVEYIRAATKIKYGTAAKTLGHEQIEIPEDLKALLSENELLEAFDKLAYTHRKEYVRWINEAKRPETRTSRLTKTAERVAAGLTFS